MAPVVETPPAPPAGAQARPLPIATMSTRATPATMDAPQGEARLSNEVAGFRYSRLKGILYAVGIVLKVPLLPLWPFFIAREASDPSLARGKKYWKTLGYCLTTIYKHFKYMSFFRLLRYNILFGPEEVKRRIAMRRGACTRCAKCCRHFDCIFLGQDAETKDFYCKVYQSDYWYYGTCGRYPLDQADIDNHGCPGFSFVEEP